MNCEDSNSRQDERFSRHIRNIETIFHKCGKNDYVSILASSSIVFARQEKRVAGVCYRLVNRIEIDPEYFNSIPYHEQLELLLHEVGHCVIGYGDHTPVPSVMQASGTLGVDFVRNFEYYINDLFSNPKNKQCKIKWADLGNEVFTQRAGEVFEMPQGMGATLRSQN